MVKKPAIQAEEPTPLSVNTGIFLASLSGTGTSAIALSNANLTATLTGSATGSALTTPGGNLKVYLECQVTFASGTPYIGLANQAFVPNAFFPGGDWNSVGFRITDGAIYMGNNNQGSSGVTAVSGNWLGIAVNFQTQSVQIRNITTSSSWSSAFSFNAQVQPSPNFFSVGLTVTGSSSTINVDGTFLGTPPDGTYTRWDVSPTPLAPASFDPFYCGSDPSSKVTLTGSNLTATFASAGLKAIAASTPGDNAAVYFEVTPTFTNAFDSTIGLMNINETVNGNFPGRIGTNSFAYHGDAGEVYLNGAGVQTGTVSWASGDIVGVAVNFPAGTIQIRNVTHSSAWSATYTFGSAISAPAPTLFCAGCQEGSQAYTVNFNGPFIGTPPAGTWTKWHTGVAPPANTLQAHIASGSATVTSPTYSPLTFDTLTTNYGVVITSGNLVFPAAVTYPILFEISVTALTAETVYIRSQWDSQTPVTFITQSVLANTATVLSGTIAAQSGTTLRVSISTSAGSKVSWSAGYVNYNTTPPPLGSLFPAFTVIVPPPPIGQGGGPPPTFPPPTPPPIGAIPPGVLVGPAIAAAGVPPSVAGITQPIFKFGSATTPPASAAFPEFTTTFPSPPIVFSNIFTDGVSPTTPPSTTTTPCVTISGNYGPPIGPALPPVVPVSRPFMMATNGNPDDVVEVQTAAGSEPNSNGEVYDDSDEENEDWVEETPRPTPKPRGRPRRK